MVKLKENIQGAYYVTDACIGCNICSEIAPNNFRTDPIQGYDYVFRQPRTDIEEQLCIEAMDICPTNAIGCDDQP